uniref:Uncharacterized protein n=1 Tax=uncultured delta proteobacterium HF0130_20J24 TaxID=710829 RepID=E0XXQ3_9DELT|nr:hypothetical protein [uncultured delta proteobacterium HF0130_20J24]
MIKVLLKSFFSLLPILLLVLIGCSNSVSDNTVSQKNSEEIATLKKRIIEQQELMNNLQSLIADLMALSSELEQVIPPRDLLESLQNDVAELRKERYQIQKNITKLANKKKEIKVPRYSGVELPNDQKKLLQGLISLQAGNPDQAVEDLQDILNHKKPTRLKAEILLAVAHSFLAQGYAKQSASHYSTFLREYPKSRHTPKALYYLGEAMMELGEQKKQKVLLNELINKYPNSPFSKRAK